MFAVAWRRLGDVPRGDETLPWLLGVARRVLSNQQRSQRRWSRLRARAARAGEHPPPTPDAQLVRNEEAAEVIAALDQLRAADREIIQLALWDELPRAEIAATLGIGRDAVDQRLSRAKRRLARLLDRRARITGRATPETRARGGAT